MFAKATRNFLKEVDDGGDLISVSHLNDCDKLQLLSLVTKKKRYWCWQRPKYQFLSVTLGDVLTEGQCLSPGMFPYDDSAPGPQTGRAPLGIWNGRGVLYWVLPFPWLSGVKGYSFLLSTITHTQNEMLCPSVVKVIVSLSLKVPCAHHKC